MSNILDNSEIEILCGNCSRKTKKTIRWIKQNSYFICNCGTKINIDASQLKSEVAKVEKEFEKLQKTLKNLGR